MPLISFRGPSDSTPKTWFVPWSSKPAVLEQRGAAIGAEYPEHLPGGDAVSRSV